MNMFTKDINSYSHSPVDTKNMFTIEPVMCLNIK